MQNRRNSKDCQGYFGVDFGVIPRDLSPQIYGKE
jgi:hypothetical protein